MLSHSVFLSRWAKSEAAERANYQLFLSELCDFLEVPRPDPSAADDSKNLYVFERSVLRRHRDGSTSVGRIDLYRHKCFVLEAKQGSEQPAQQASLLEPAARLRRGTAVRGTGGWDEAMVRARFQAEAYAKDLPVAEGWPPFLIVVDVGHTIELFADFSQTGKAYVPFPDAGTHRVYLADLSIGPIRERLRKVWLGPLDLDPAQVTARVTRHVAEQLAELAKAMEGSHEPEKVASFLMRCIFTSFAEDVRLLPERGWTKLLESLRDDIAQFKPMVEALWRTMNDGGYSPIFREHVLRFNGGLFDSVEALPVTRPQLDLLIRAAQAQWQDVEPAIFGTLLERALDRNERHRLGAHYTPRAYVERLVFPTVIAPLREEWKSVQTAAVALGRSGKTEAALDEVQGFRKRLCGVRVLDPACGSGNFLYVTLEHLKRLEGEVIDVLESLGDTQQTLVETGLTVDPHQLLGMEVNPRAAVITDLVLWIGYLQWYFRTWGASAVPPEPVIKRFHNVECRDAILAWDSIEPALDADGQPETQWDGRTMRAHPVTGEQVPDENARRQVVCYRGARRADWPEADFVVGNPPFIGSKYMRAELGDGYVEALRGVYSEVPDSTDYVMYWWHRAAELARKGTIGRFGFITTNSIRQTFSRRVVSQHLEAANPVSLIFAIPDHPWVDSTDGAAVRIAMTTTAAGKREGLLCKVIAEIPMGEEGAMVTLTERTGVIHSDLSIGPNVGSAQSLAANEGLSCPGVKLHGSGFIVTPEKARGLGLGRVAALEQHIRLYRNGRDLTARSRNVMVIDLFGLEAENVRTRYPEVFQHLLNHVKGERESKINGTKDQADYASKWWLFGKPRGSFRPALKGLSRFIASPVTAKHRFFVFMDRQILPDDALMNFASDDAFVLGTLSSRIHVAWALAAGARLGVGNDPRYIKSRCFEPFPFPAATEPQRQRIRELGEALDGHRKRQQELHPTLTMTQMYNVLEKLRSGETLSVEERRIHEQGLISTLRTLHDDLDGAVAEAYGWPAAEETEEMLFRLVALNAERAAEERQGNVRYLRPEFQSSGPAMQTGFQASGATAVTGARRERKAWPVSVSERVRAVRELLAAQSEAITPETLAKEFQRARAADLRDILETLVSLGQARQDGNAFLL